MIGVLIIELHLVLNFAFPLLVAWCARLLPPKILSALASMVRSPLCQITLVYQASSSAYSCPTEHSVIEQVFVATLLIVLGSKVLEILSWLGELGWRKVLVWWRYLR
jgi:hypothetical protein